MKITKSDYVFIALALVTGVLCLIMRGTGVTLQALGNAGMMLLMVLPQLAAGLLIGGLVQRLVSREKVATLLGSRSGFRGLALATFAGALTPGGPFTSFPLVFALWKAGADAGSLIAYLASWALIGFNRIIVWELPLMGLEFTWIRVLVCLPLPFIAGYCARLLSGIPALRMQEAEEQ